MSATSPSPSRKTRAPAESRPTGLPDQAQVNALLDAAIDVAMQLGSSPSKPITIHQREAEYLQLIPHQLLHDITNLAIRRVQMRDGHDYMQKGDIDWAWTRLVVGKRTSGWIPILNSVGGILIGAGIPIVVSPFLSNQPLGTGGLLLAVLLLVPGLVFLSLALAFTVFRR